MPNPVRCLTATVALVVLSLVACTGDSDESNDPTPITTVEASTGTASATVAPTSSPTEAPRETLTDSDFASQVCLRADDASTRALDAFVVAADRYQLVIGDSTAEAAALEVWATEASDAWLDAAEWAETIEPPPDHADFHRKLQAAFASLASERVLLAAELSAPGDADVWILAQRAWAMTLLEPLPFVGIRHLIPSASVPALFREACGPLSPPGGQVTLSPSTELVAYSAQLCWLHQLGWEQQQVNLQDLGVNSDPTLGLEPYRAATTTFTRQETRTQILLGLGLQAITAPPPDTEFHDELAVHSATRLLVSLVAEEAIENALTTDEMRGAINNLLLEFAVLAEDLISIRDGSTAELQTALASYEQCGALDGSELAFYEALTG